MTHTYTYIYIYMHIYALQVPLHVLKIYIKRGKDMNAVYWAYYVNIILCQHINIVCLPYIHIFFIVVVCSSTANDLAFVKCISQTTILISYGNSYVIWRRLLESKIKRDDVYMFLNALGVIEAFGV